MALRFVKAADTIARGRSTPCSADRAVRIELFTARVLCRVSYRVLEYSMDTGSSY